MKKFFYSTCIPLLTVLCSFGQPQKLYFVYLDPISIAFRNPTFGAELFIKKHAFNSIYVEASYMIQDHKVGGFLGKGYPEEQSKLSPFVSYPRNKYPFYVYNGPTFRVGTTRYFHSKKFQHYSSFSILAKLLKYDSLKVNYNNNIKEKRGNLFNPVKRTTHYRTQSERLNSVGIGMEYGIKRVIDNVIINFFVRVNVLYSMRHITTYNEQYNEYSNSQLTFNASDLKVRNVLFNVIQFRPEVGLRLGLTNF